ncbi:uncharacterized protein C1orf50 homolog [Anomaloglossus baeobatrachus]|uniref:uncharacterized protein C1orf50 homolog n=1 Tax=Anomaloglossus baeobatrachus TaxID=238106 RepID=UPI003F501805
MEGAHSQQVTTVSLVESSSRPSRVQLVSTYQTHRIGDPSNLVELAQQVQKADDFIRANACNRLTVIAEQIRILQEQARKFTKYLLFEVITHKGGCSVIYSYFFFLFHPLQDWGPSCPHEFLAAYKLQHDMSWTPFENIERRDAEISIIDKLLNDQIALPSSAEPNFKGLTN